MNLMIFDILYTRLFVQYGKTLLNYFGVTIYLKQNYKKKPHIKTINFHEKFEVIVRIIGRATLL